MNSIGNNGTTIIGYDDLDIDSANQSVFVTDGEAQNALQGSTLNHLNRVSYEHNRIPIMDDTTSVISCRSIRSVNNGQQKGSRSVTNHIVANEEDSEQDNHQNKHQSSEEEYVVVAANEMDHGVLQHQAQRSTKQPKGGLGQQELQQEHQVQKPSSEEQHVPIANADTNNQVNGPYVKSTVGTIVHAPKGRTGATALRSEATAYGKLRMFIGRNPLLSLILVAIIIAIIYYVFVKDQPSTNNANTNVVTLQVPNMISSPEMTTSSS